MMLKKRGLFLALLKTFFTPKALHNIAQGRVSAPWEGERARFPLP
jgi:hypothetical protein